MDLADETRPLASTLLPEKHTTAFFGLTFFPLVAGMIVASATASSVDSWYRHIRTPWFTPPNHAFGPLWTVAYLSMGYASFLVYRATQERGLTLTPLLVYSIQLGLNFGWSLIFFSMRNMLLAFLEASVLLVSTAITAFLFSRVDRLAMWLMFPSLGIVSLAVAISFWIMRHNPTPVEVVSASRKTS